MPNSLSQFFSNALMMTLAVKYYVLIDVLYTENQSIQIISCLICNCINTPKKIFYSNNYRNNLFMEYCLKYKLQSNQSYMTFQGNSEIWCLIWPSKETVKYGVLYDLPRKQWNMVSYMTFQGNSEIWCLIWPSKETVKYGHTIQLVA
jgi:hypothetical protein